jgi:predicted GNAT family acetyltransferase
MKQLSHEPDARRYVLRIDEQIVAVADYAINGNQISFHHTFTNPRFRNQGYAAEVVKFAMDDVEQNTTYRVLPMCWYVADWFEANHDRRNLLTRA